MKPSPDSLYKWALATGGEILHVVECVAEWSADRKRLEEVGRLVEIYATDVGLNEGVLFDDHKSLPRIRAIIAGEKK